jgi:hypothetical protein
VGIVSDTGRLVVIVLYAGAVQFFTGFIGVAVFPAGARVWNVLFALGLIEALAAIFWLKVRYDDRMRARERDLLAAGRCPRCEQALPGRLP